MDMGCLGYEKVAFLCLPVESQVSKNNLFLSENMSNFKGKKKKGKKTNFIGLLSAISSFCGRN